jgi:hypothetical protein
VSHGRASGTRRAWYSWAGTSRPMSGSANRSLGLIHLYQDAQFAVIAVLDGGRIPRFLGISHFHLKPSQPPLLGNRMGACEEESAADSDLGCVSEHPIQRNSTRPRRPEKPWGVRNHNLDPGNQPGVKAEALAPARHLRFVRRARSGRVARDIVDRKLSDSGKSCDPTGARKGRLIMSTLSAERWEPGRSRADCAGSPHPAPCSMGHHTQQRRSRGLNLDRDLPLAVQPPAPSTRRRGCAAPAVVPTDHLPPGRRPRGRASRPAGVAPGAGPGRGLAPHVRPACADGCSPARSLQRDVPTRRRQRVRPTWDPVPAATPLRNHGRRLWLPPRWSLTIRRRRPGSHLRGQGRTMARQWDVGVVSVSSTTELLSRLSRPPMARRAEQLRKTLRSDGGTLKGRSRHRRVPSGPCGLLGIVRGFNGPRRTVVVGAQRVRSNAGN